jgi:hypothetical protein
MNTIDDYLSLPYTIELIREDETTWFSGGPGFTRRSGALSRRW